MVMGLKHSTGDWMDIRHICCKNCFIFLKTPKTNEKEAGYGPF